MAELRQRPTGGDGDGGRDAGGDLRCPICQDNPLRPDRRPLQTGCGHILCGLCAGRAFGKNRLACPVCRAKVRALTALATMRGAAALASTPGAKVARIKYAGITYSLDVAPPKAGLLGGRDWATALRQRVEPMFGLRADRMRLICRGRNVALGGAATAATAATATAGTGGVLAAEAYLDGTAPAVLVATAKELQEDYGTVATRVARTVGLVRAWKALVAALAFVWSVVWLFFESLLPIKRAGDPEQPEAAIARRRDNRGRPPGGAGGAGDGGFGFRG